jgi:hypothetical protein
LLEKLLLCDLEIWLPWAEVAIQNLSALSSAAYIYYHLFSKLLKIRKDFNFCIIYFLNGCAGFSFDREIFIGLQQQSKKKPFRTGLKAVLKTVM